MENKQNIIQQNIEYINRITNETNEKRLDIIYPSSYIGNEISYINFSGNLTNIDDMINNIDNEMSLYINTDNINSYDIIHSKLEFDSGFNNNNPISKSNIYVSLDNSFENYKEQFSYDVTGLSYIYDERLHNESLEIDENRMNGKEFYENTLNTYNELSYLKEANIVDTAIYNTRYTNSMFIKDYNDDSIFDLTDLNSLKELPNFEYDDFINKYYILSSNVEQLYYIDFSFEYFSSYSYDMVELDNIGYEYYQYEYFDESYSYTSFNINKKNNVILNVERRFNIYEMSIEEIANEINKYLIGNLPNIKNKESILSLSYNIIQDAFINEFNTEIKIYRRQSKDINSKRNIIRKLLGIQSNIMSSVIESLDKEIKEYKKGIYYNDKFYAIVDNSKNRYKIIYDKNDYKIVFDKSCLLYRGLPILYIDKNDILLKLRKITNENINEENLSITASEGYFERNNNFLRYMNKDRDNTHNIDIFIKYTNNKLLSKTLKIKDIFFPKIDVSHINIYGGFDDSFNSLNVNILDSESYINFYFGIEIINKNAGPENIQYNMAHYGYENGNIYAVFMSKNLEYIDDISIINANNLEIMQNMSTNSISIFSTILNINNQIENDSINGYVRIRYKLPQRCLKNTFKFKKNQQKIYKVTKNNIVEFYYNIDNIEYDEIDVYLEEDIPINIKKL